MTKADPEVARKFLLAGTSVLPIGIALAAAGRQGLAPIVTLAGLSLLVAGLHTFGRSGPDPGRH